MGWFNGRQSDEEYYAELPAIERRKERLRAARRKGTHTQKEWEALVAVFCGRCVCCGSVGLLERDHVEAIANGGCDCIANIQPLCDSCNSSKCAREGDFREAANPTWSKELVSFLELAKP